MCELISALGFAASAASTVAGFQAQRDEAKATREAALAANRDETLQITRRQIQEQDASAQQRREVQLDEAQRRSEVELSGAESGVAGISLDNLLAGVQQRGATDRETLNTNLKNTMSQLQLEKKGSGTRAQSRINSAPKPSALGLVAGIGSSALGAYNSHTKRMS